MNVIQTRLGDIKEKAKDASDWFFQVIQLRSPSSDSSFCSDENLVLNLSKEEHLRLFKPDQVQQHQHQQLQNKKKYNVVWVPRWIAKSKKGPSKFAKLLQEQSEAKTWDNFFGNIEPHLQTMHTRICISVPLSSSSQNTMKIITDAAQKRELRWCMIPLLSQQIESIYLLKDEMETDQGSGKHTPQLPRFYAMAFYKAL